MKKGHTHTKLYSVLLTYKERRTFIAFCYTIGNNRIVTHVIVSSSDRNTDNICIFYNVVVVIYGLTKGRIVVINVNDS